MSETKQIEKDLVVLGKIVKVVDEALEDKHVSTAEIIKIAFKSIDVIGVVKSLSQAKEEFQKMSEEDVSRIIEVFKKEFDLRNDKAEELVESVIAIGVGIAISSGIFKK